MVGFFAGLYSQVFFATILVTRLEYFSVSSSETGLYLGIRPAAMLFGTVLCIIFLQRGCRPGLVFVGLIIEVLALILCGPSRIFGLPVRL